MRQWELIGITDGDRFATPPTPSPSPSDPAPLAIDEHEFFWATDTALRIRVMSEAAANVLGWPSDRCLGQDLLSLFGLGGPNFDVVSAHVTALGGEPDTFVLDGSRATVRCWVEPVHDETGRLSGTRCLAIAMESVDVRDLSTRSAVA